MSVKQIATGVFVDDEEIIEVVLSNNKGSFVSILNYGTIIKQFVIRNAAGSFQDIVLGFDDVASYISSNYLANYPYFGAVIGRYANRIQDAQFTLSGHTYDLPMNTPGSCLHGGLSGFDKKVWDLAEIDSAISKVTFQYESVDGEEGFPGNLFVELSFQLTEHDELILSYEASTDQTTPVNLTHHSYFNLSANGSQIVDHVHQMNADYYLEQNENWAVNGNLLPVANTRFDFRQPKKIAADWDSINGYDQTFVLNKTYGDLTLASRTSNEQTGLSLLVYTTEPVAHLYTAKYLAVQGGKGGRSYSQFEAFCVETQHHPNAVNIPSFPNTLLEPGDLYHQTTIYKVNVNQSSV